ncbi:hypothetical protein [Mesorhizobium sp. CN2-181]|uniref:hypothetical protein n=1 Tax=Mesorhizobium yinganensis TaxID=3157707 RepID=UPI0032B822AA
MSSIFVLEIGGRPTIAVEAFDQADAASWLADEIVQSDLKELLTIFGHPLWDGVEALTMRQGTAAEAQTWRSGFTAGAISGTYYGGPSTYFAVKLVPIIEPQPIEGHNFI